MAANPLTEYPAPYSNWSTLCVILLCFAISGCGGTESEQAESQDGHTRMLVTLQQIQDRTLDEHPYLGDAQLRQARDALARLPKAAKGSRFQTQWVLAYHLARAGKLQESISNFRIFL